MLIFTKTRCVNTQMVNCIGTNEVELFVSFPFEQASMTLAIFPNERAANECLKDIQNALEEGAAVFRLEVADYGG